MHHAGSQSFKDCTLIVNLLFLNSECPACGKFGLFALQFRYGDVWRHQYRLGDMIRFGKGQTDVGVAGISKVVVSAALNWCDHCQNHEHRHCFDCYIFVENDKLVGFAPDDGTYDFSNGDDFIVVEE